MLSLPAFLVTDHERLYTLAFWAKATGGPEGAPKPRPHVTFQDEDADYAWISGEHVQVSAAAAAVLSLSLSPTISLSDLPFPSLSSRPSGISTR